jgi:5-(carboxyamino)imidazole ribonucleotide synthase
MPTFSPILPGSTLGVLGSGQLGRMFALSARRMGYRIATFSPDRDSPTGQVADREVVASYEDLDAVRRFAEQVAAVTFEFENVPFATAEAAADRVPVRPAGEVLHTTQHRVREKTFLRNNGFPITDFHPISSLAELVRGVNDISFRAGGFSGVVLKTSGWGYDGKGQATVRSLDQLESAWASLGTTQAVVEALVDFEREISVVAARGLDGAFCHWGVIDNTHHNHILDTSVAPAAVPPNIANEAIAITRGVLEQLDVVGVLTVEFFLTRSGKLLVNELAPRPHNSGHLTVDATLTSQFEQQVRTVCGLPMGDTTLLRPAAMANLLGDLWRRGDQTSEPNWAAALGSGGEVKLHLYGKADPRTGRKMGHLTALADSTDVALQRVLAARGALAT